MTQNIFFDCFTLFVLDPEPHSNISLENENYCWSEKIHFLTCPLKILLPQKAI